MSSLLILTVGTGTSGQHSNLAQGLVNTLHQLRPRLFWLVPSASPDSTTLAEIVREGAPAGCAFQPWSPTQPFRQIAQHDDLFVCRTALREVIQRARQQLIQGEELIVNPTSGTKQMSVAATLAALDEGIGEIVFTVGERADGVVKTGTERMAAFSTRQFFLERDLRMDVSAVTTVAEHLRNLLHEHLPGVLACWGTVHRPRTLAPAIHSPSQPDSL